MLITENAYAKINLHLDVTGKRDDGYHNIRSIMQTVSLHDTVTVERLTPRDGEREIRLTCSDTSLPCDSGNLAYRAATAFFDAAHICEYSVAVHIEKRIPTEAGLAGGSSDAAAVLRALSSLFGDPFTARRLCDIGRTLGADVPFCIMGGTYLCEGIGEMLSPLPPMPDCHIVIARAGRGVSTPKAYGLIDSACGNVFVPRDEEYERLYSSLLGGDISTISASMYNIFEAVILKEHTEARLLREIMLRHGALGAMMSGSGPSVFGIFDDIKKADAAADEAASLTQPHLCAPTGAFPLSISTEA